MKDWLLQKWSSFKSIFKQSKCDYTDYVCLIEPKSSFLTPLQADTLWAALMWAHRYKYGAEETQKFIDHNPPKLIISDGFPYGFLPKPKNFILIERVNQIVKDEFAHGDWNKQLMGIEIAKRLAERTLLPSYLVDRLLRGETEENILRECLNVRICPKLLIKRSEIARITAGSKTISLLVDQYCNRDHCDALTAWSNHSEKMKRQLRCTEIMESEHLYHYQLVKQKILRKNVIHRSQMTTLEEDGLYSHRELYLLGSLWWIFIRANKHDADKITELFKLVEQYGYGKRKSTGKGQFKFIDLEPLEKEGRYHIKPIPRADGFMALSSSYVPRKGDFDQSYYSFHIKRGKVDGHLSTGSEKFIKYPVAMYEVGSIFKVKRKKDFYGRLVENIHSDRKELVQYGYTFPLMGKFFGKRENNNG